MDGGARLQVTLLGVFRVSCGDTVLAISGTRLQNLLVRLALAGGRPVTPAVLIDAIWGEEPPSDPAHALQRLVSRLRRALTPDAPDPAVVVQVAGGYRLAVETSDVDAVRFEELAANGQEPALSEAVALWGDRPGVEPAAIAAVAPTVATRLAQTSVEVVADLADAELSSGRAEAAAARLSGLLGEHPGHERAAALLMDALAVLGRQAEALAVYERVRETLADVLGADPGTALRERHLRLLRPEPPRPATGAIVNDLPVPGGSDADLPTPLTSFIGRDDDLARISALLTTGRLATVVGPGGAGKTRLALEAAHRLRHEYHDGVRLVDLAAVTDPAEVTTAVLAAIGPRTGGLLKRADNDDFGVLLAELSGRETLLLLDNCEHLIDTVAHLISSLLPRCSGLRVLATSREPLTVDGEGLVPLAPLELPGPDTSADEARDTASVRLFTARAAAVRPGFAVDETTLPFVVRLVRGLDGMPLALELAAARLRTLSLPDLADGLADRFRILGTGSRTAPARHRTLRAVIAWSWDLLDTGERAVAERIAVLPGGITVRSATAVCKDIADVPDLLAALVDRSLLHLDPVTGRYRMLETIRGYGSERLAEAGALGSARDLAAAYFAALMTEQDPRLRGPGQLDAVRTVDAEYDNTLAALHHLCATGDVTGAIALALHLTWYWQMRGRHADAVHWLSEALAVPGEVPAPARDCARAAYLLNRADITSGISTPDAIADRTEMRELTDRLLAHPHLPDHFRMLGAILLFLQDERAALATFERLADGDDRWSAGLAHMFQAEIAENEGALDRMRHHVEAALDHFHRVGDQWATAAVLPMRATLRRYDDVDGALTDLNEARILADKFGALGLGDQFYRDLNWIDLHLRRGDTSRAIIMLDAARVRAVRASSAEMLVLIDAHEAALRVRTGDLDRARDLLDAAERGLRHVTAFPADHARALVCGTRAALLLVLDDLPGADEALAAAHAAALATRELPVLARVTVQMAAAADRQGQPHRSAALLGAAARQRGAHDRTDPQICELTRRGKAALGEKEFAAAYEAGTRGAQ
ncbi:SARP family transcriptional regulator [Actinoplanes lobatus]|uniref:Putative ATPase/DNA-binding SARP family transcriptional activator n=1 Tax=Actinoplanes lobatus TaxID=113568 RepID=A0A7W7MJ29_9ACTN|nr:BTAD domain-containing putative transcriptional regulator [Actinoplanes lobatus]MBB4752207.1 putative ATPase/DNA-binding SARP family transcriptional activator [Actinoplanes lobatus]GGN83814.1 SARP family transcriptional regulator [Actinoplanes lobatus]GIE46020.1 SARP family transcriptional regulator [Actinoplanes lobatus]